MNQISLRGQLGLLDSSWAKRSVLSVDPYEASARIRLGKRVLLTRALFKPKARYFLRNVINIHPFIGQIGHPVDFPHVQRRANRSI